jgi:hypothetical protein
MLFDNICKIRIYILEKEEIRYTRTLVYTLKGENKLKKDFLYPVRYEQHSIEYAGAHYHSAIQSNIAE